MLNQGFQNPQLVPANGLNARFPAPNAGLTDDQLWLQPRTASTTAYGLKPADVQLMPGQQVYGSNAGYKPAALQGLPFMANESEFNRAQNNIQLGFLQQQQQQQQQQTMHNGMNQFAQRIPQQNTMANTQNAPWQLLQQQNSATLAQQNFAANNMNSLYMQQGLAGGNAAALEAAKIAQNNQLAAAQARAMQQQQQQQQQLGGHMNLQNQFANPAVVQALSKANLVQNARVVQNMNPRLPANRVAMPGMQQPQLSTLGSGYVGNQGLLAMNSGLVGQGVNGLLNNAVAHRDALLQQQQQQAAQQQQQQQVALAAATAARMQQAQQAQLQAQQQQQAQNLARANYMNQLALATTAAMAYNAPVSSSMMLDNQATLLKMQQQQQQQQQQNALKANLDALAGQDPRGLAAGITQADLMFNRAAAAAAVPAIRTHIPQPQPGGQLVNQYVQAQVQAQAAARRSPFDSLATTMSTSSPQDQILTPNNMFKMPVGGNQLAAISRPMPAAAPVRPGSGDPAVSAPSLAGAPGFQTPTSAAPAPANTAPLNMLSQLQLGVKSPAATAQVPEGVLADAVGKTSPPEELDVVLAYVGENFARMNITIDQAIAHGILGGLGAAQVKIVRDAHDAELTRMRAAAALAAANAAADANTAVAAVATPPTSDTVGDANPPTMQHLAALGGLSSASSGAQPVAAAVAAASPVAVPESEAAPEPEPAVDTEQKLQVAPGVPADAPPAAELPVVAVPEGENDIDSDAVLVEKEDAVPAAVSEGVDAGEKPVQADGQAVVPADAVSGAAAPISSSGEDLPFDAFSYGFFGAMVPDNTDTSLLEALEPDGGLVADDSAEAENVAPAVDVGLDLKSSDATASEDAEWSASKAMSQELNLDKAVGDDVLSSKFHRLDLGCGFN